MTRNWPLWGLAGVLAAVAAGGCSQSPSAASLSFQEQVAAAQKESDPETRVKRLIDVGRQQGKAQDRVGASETLEIARKEAQGIGDAETRTSALALLGAVQASLDERIAARKSIASALTAAAEVKRPETKARLLTRITQAQVVAGDMDAALATLKSAEEVIAAVEDPQGRILVYCDVAGGYKSLDQAADCDRLFEAALGYAKTIADAKKRCPLLTELAAKQAELHETETSAKTFDLAIESAGKIEKPYFRAYAMGDIAERLSKAGFRIKAKRVLDQAEGVAEKVPEQDMQMQAVQRVRSLMGKLPQGEG